MSAEGKSNRQLEPRRKIWLADSHETSDIVERYLLVQQGKRKQNLSRRVGLASFHWNHFDDCWELEFAEVVSTQMLFSGRQERIKSGFPERWV